MQRDQFSRILGRNSKKLTKNLISGSITSKNSRLSHYKCLKLGQISVYKNGESM